MELNSSGGDTHSQSSVKRLANREDQPLSTVTSGGTISASQLSQYNSHSEVRLIELSSSDQLFLHDSESVGTDGSRGHVYRDTIQGQFWTGKNYSKSYPLKVVCPLNDQWLTTQTTVKCPARKDSLTSSNCENDREDSKWLKDHYRNSFRVRPYKEKEKGSWKSNADGVKQRMYVLESDDRSSPLRRTLMAKIVRLGEQSSLTRFDGSSSMPEVRDDTVEEIRTTLRSLKHKNLVRVLDLCIQNSTVTSGSKVKTDKSRMDDTMPKIRLVLVTNYCQHIGTLEGLVKAKQPSILPEPVSRHYFSQMVSAVKYLHDQGIVHRSLNCDNILLSVSNEVKIVGLETARRHADAYGVFWEICNDVRYRSPQMIKDDLYNPRGADVWALGIILFRTTFGRLPFFIHYRMKQERRQQQQTSSHKDFDPRWDHSDMESRNGISGEDNPKPKRMKCTGESNSEDESEPEDLVIEVDGAEMCQKLKFPHDVEVSPNLKELLIGVLQAEEKYRSSINKVSQEEWLVFKNIKRLGNCQEVLNDGDAVEIILRKKYQCQGNNGNYEGMVGEADDSVIETQVAVGNYHKVRRPVRIKSCAKELDIKEWWYA